MGNEGECYGALSLRPRFWAAVPLRQELPRSQKLLPFSLKNRTFSLVSHPILDTRELHEDGVPRPAP